MLGKAATPLVSGLPLLQAIKQIEDDEYYVGLDKNGNPLPDGETLDVPAGVTLMIDEGAVFNMRQSNIDVGSSSPLVSREHAAIQVLGTPSNRVVFTGYRDSEFRENPVIYDLNLPYVTANVTDVVAAALVGTLDTAGLAQSVTLSSDGITAYVADQSAGLQIINLSDPANASVLNTVPTTDSAVGVALSSDGTTTTAYVADSAGGLQIIDVSNPATASVTGSVSTSGTAVDVALSSDGTTAYVADSLSGLQIIDLVTETVTNTVATSGIAVSVTLSDDGLTAYVADSVGGLEIIDITDPAAPVTNDCCHTRHRRKRSPF